MIAGFFKALVTLVSVGVVLSLAGGGAAASGPIQMQRYAVIPTPAEDIVSASQGFDLDHDSRREFIIRPQSSGDGPTEIYECTADNTFVLAHVIQPESPDKYRPKDAGDIDDDGLSDLVMMVSDLTESGWVNSMRVYESESAGTYPTQLAWEKIKVVNPTDIAKAGLIADTDGDGRQEIVTQEDLWPGPYALIIYENDGDNSYVESYSGVIPGTSNLIQSWEVANDVDGDGRSEILMGGWLEGNSRVIAFENTGDNDYEIVWSWDFDPTINVTFIVDAGDLDGDGEKEFLAGGLQGGPLDSYLHVFEAVGDNEFQIVATFVRPNTVEAYSSANLADVHGDGQREIVFGTAWSVAIYENTGDNAWSEIWSEDWQGAQVGPVEYIGAGDHDQDGKDELIFRQEGFFGQTGVWEINPADAADMDMDGTVDVIDNCPTVVNFTQSDADGDDVGDLCDNCIYGPNPEQGLAIFGQEVLALNSETLSWAEPAEIDYVRGDLALVDMYIVDVFETLPLGALLDDPLPPGSGEGFFYLVKPDCAVGSWQTTLGAEPDRDAELP